LRSVNLPVAVKPTCPWGLLEAVADEGATVMLVSIACPAPPAISSAARSKSKPKKIFHGISNKV
jgi:hypothetical protein